MKAFWNFIKSDFSYLLFVITFVAMFVFSVSFGYDYAFYDSAVEATNQFMDMCSSFPYASYVIIWGSLFTSAMLKIVLSSAYFVFDRLLDKTWELVKRYMQQ